MFIGRHDKVRPPMHQLVEKQSTDNISLQAVFVGIDEDHTLKLFRGAPLTAIGIGRLS